MVAYNKFNDFAEQLGIETHDMANDTFKIALTNTAPNATNTQLSHITQIAGGNGYATGGTTIASTAWSETGGTATASGNDVVFTASGGNIGPLRYAVYYNDTAANDELIAWWDYGSSVTVADGETFTVDFGASIFTLK